MTRRSLYSVALATLLFQWGVTTGGIFSQSQAEAGPEKRIASHHKDEHSHEAVFFIEGTDVFFDEFGLPSELFGTLLTDDGKPIGTYQEIVVPIFDPVFGFIGTTGVSTFTFTNKNGKHVFGTVVSENMSLIEGFDPATGALLVSSTGTIVSGTGAFREVEGGICTSSSVIFGDVFVLNTELTLKLAEGFDGRSFHIRKRHRR